MVFQKVVFHSIPQIHMAHSHRSTNYDLSIQRPARFMEISYTKVGPGVRILQDGSRIPVPAPSISATVFDGGRILCKSDAPLHIHYTFGLQGDWTACPLSADEIMSWMQSGFRPAAKYPLCVLLPSVTDDIKCVSALAPAFQEITAAYAGYSPFRTVNCLDRVFHIFSVLTDWCITEAIRSGSGNLAPASVFYCRRAIEYMQTFIHRHLTAEEIANELQISPAHLSRVFKAVTGCGLVEYNNRLKLQLAKQLLETRDIPLREVAAQIGITDEKYFSRLFKKYTGMTAGAFKKSI